MKIIQRVFQYIDFKGINKSELERKCGVSNGYFAKMKARNADIGESIIFKILENCPDVSPDWLVFNKGDMLLTYTSFHKSNKPATEIYAEMDPKIKEAFGDKTPAQKQRDSDFIDKLLDRLETQSQEIYRLKAENEALKNGDARESNLIRVAVGQYS